jgi:Exo-beta-D-glucosaminidase Ig-fold domain/Glycosyl hydrolases family 2/Glycosyl hydrolases family 2, sugar binding domain/Glycosyl hydrolases family 2, TIM barrel domain
VLIRRRNVATQLIVGSSLLFAGLALLRAESLPSSVDLNLGWQLQDSAKVSEAGAAVSAKSYQPQGWMAATVPGTILTSMVNDGVYPEPLYGENNRPDRIPESLNQMSYWYRTVFTVPKNFEHQQMTLHFDGVNFASEVWVNGTQLGSIRGAFIRGGFDITRLVKPGETAVLAVKVSPPPHPGNPHEHTIANGLGENGGITAIDGPTFLSTIGWDWLPAIRDRDTGIWQKVWLSAAGPVLVEDPLVTTDLPLPRTDAADVTVKVTVRNTSAKEQRGVLEGQFGDVSFEEKVSLAPNGTQVVRFDPTTTSAMHVANPKLWWPNGYGPQNLYTLHLHFVQGGRDSDKKDVTFGVRKITYESPGSDALTISVNGVKVFIRGGDWGLDEGLKRIPRARLDAEMRMHQMAHLNMIRNWVGQSTSEDFYELCDKYGILIWDEFFQPNPSDGPNPDDLQTYLANVRDKILRFRNHPSIALWCARNEGYPPKEIDDALRVMLPELDPVRLYQPSSTAGRGVVSHGPYYWREPRAFYVYDAPFKTETGSVSVPTLESVQGMMPEKDWETIDDDWAEHDLAKGAQHGDTYPYVLAGRYGRVVNLADFVRKAQLMNFEAFRAMYEGRNAKLFQPYTGILTWMSHPAQPSFVWQLYHYDMEPNSSLFAVESAAEPIHIQLDESNGMLQVINNTPQSIANATASLSLLNLDGKSVLEHKYPVTGGADSAIGLGEMPIPDGLSAVYFVKLELHDAGGKVLSRNLYWKANAANGEDLSPLDTLPTVQLKGEITRHDADGRVLLSVTLSNPGKTMALMVHLQLRRKRSGERVLPVFYSDNYVSLAADETRTVTVDAASADLTGDTPLVALDGWNVSVIPVSNPDSALDINQNALVTHRPATGLPMITAGLDGSH